MARASFLHALAACGLRTSGGRLAFCCTLVSQKKEEAREEREEKRKGADERTPPPGKPQAAPPEPGRSILDDEFDGF